MADLTARIKPKKSSTTGEVPSAGDLEVAELAVNTADGKLFVKHTDNSIKEISGGGGATSLSDLSDVALYPPTGTWPTDNAENSAGGWNYTSSQYLYINYTDSAAYDWTSDWTPYFSTSGTFYIRNTGTTTWLSVAYSNALNIGGIHIQINTTALASTPGWTNSGGIEFSFVDPETTTATNGEFLSYDATAAEWTPASLTGASLRTTLGIGEYVDDAAAGTGGVTSGALYYNTTSSDYRLKT